VLNFFPLLYVYKEEFSNLFLYNARTLAYIADDIFMKELLGDQVYFYVFWNTSMHLYSAFVSLSFQYIKKRLNKLE